MRRQQRPRERVAIGLGSNLGDRAAHLGQAIAALREALGRLGVSSFHETMPVDCSADAPPFLNAAVAARTALSPVALLRLCQEIEQSLGRPAVRGYHVDRIIDLDILLYGTRQIDRPELRVPQPGLRERTFVLDPLVEVAPDWPVPPDLQPVRALHATCQR